eukprot:2902550-Pyramimonas_sp.AAC.1
MDFACSSHATATLCDSIAASRPRIELIHSSFALRNFRSRHLPVEAAGGQGGRWALHGAGNLSMRD